MLPEFNLSRSAMSGIGNRCISVWYRLRFRLIDEWRGRNKMNKMWKMGGFWCMEIGATYQHLGILYPPLTAYISMHTSTSTSYQWTIQPKINNLWVLLEELGVYRLHHSVLHPFCYNFTFDMTIFVIELSLLSWHDIIFLTSSLLSGLLIFFLNFLVIYYDLILASFHICFSFLI